MGLHLPGGFGDGSFGVLYAALDEATAIAEMASVRWLGGECVAGFRPDLFSGCRPAGTVQFFWVG
jgi:hypothetical protein